MMIVMVVKMTIHDDDDGEDDNADNHHDHDHNDTLVQELPLEMAARSKEAARLTKVSPIIF